MPYVWKADQAVPPVDLLAAPVMQGDRYQAQPIYFSDVVVRQDSRFYKFADLRGCRWAYNEPRSHSGCYVTRSYLATLGEFASFLVRRLRRALTKLPCNEFCRIDAAAIDSTVLALELQRCSDIAAQIRVIHTLEASLIPPWVVSAWMPQTLSP